MTDDNTDWESLLDDVFCGMCDEPIAKCVCNEDIEESPDYDKHAFDEDDLEEQILARRIRELRQS